MLLLVAKVVVTVGSIIAGIITVYKVCGKLQKPKSKKKESEQTVPDPLLVGRAVLVDTEMVPAYVHAPAPVYAPVYIPPSASPRDMPDAKPRQPAKARPPPIALKEDVLFDL